MRKKSAFITLMLAILAGAFAINSAHAPAAITVFHLGTPNSGWNLFWVQNVPPGTPIFAVQLDVNGAHMPPPQPASPFGWTVTKFDGNLVRWNARSPTFAIPSNQGLGFTIYTTDWANNPTCGYFVAWAAFNMWGGIVAGGWLGPIP